SFRAHEMASGGCGGSGRTPQPRSGPPHARCSGSAGLVSPERHEMTPTPRERYLANLQAEIDGAALYRVLAELEAGSDLAPVYTRMAETEERHADLWRARLRELG